MTFFRYQILCCLLCFGLGEGRAQIHVDAQENIGIGTTTVGDSKMRLYNALNSRGLNNQHSYALTNTDSYGIYNYISAEGLGSKYGFYNDTRQSPNSSGATIGQYNRTFPDGSGTAYSIYNRLENFGTGPRIGYLNYSYQGSSSAKYLYSYKSLLYNYGTGPTYGYYSHINGLGTGIKEGITGIVYQPTNSDQYARGMYTVMRNLGTGNTYGVDTYIYDVGNRTKMGMRNRVFTNENSINNNFGLYNQTFLYGQASGSAGIWSRVYDGATSDGVKYGFYNYVEDRTTSASNRYGIYNYLENQGGGTNYALWSSVEGNADYAGYFDGNVVVTGSLIYGTSDGRLKEKTKELQGALGMISRLRPKSYFFKKDQNIALPGGLQYGLIAQELEEVIPDLVYDVKHPGKPIYKKVMATAADRLPVPDGEEEAIAIAPGDQRKDGLALAPQTEASPEAYREEVVGYEADRTYKAINYQALIPVLVGAVQELQAEVEELKAEVTRLKSKE